MNLIERIWQSSLGKKYVMAITGAALVLFAVGHLVGNLQVFGHPDLINGYAHFLKSKPTLLWGVRLGLLCCVGLHIAAAASLTLAGRAARPVGYVKDTAYGASAGSRYMMVSGSVILAFVVYHLAHFTALLPGVNGTVDFRKLTTELHGEKVADVYAMMLLGFQVWWVVVFYLIAQALLFMHLGHGLAAMFQSLGLRNRVWWPRIECLARIVSIALFAGYAIIPVSIYLRMVGSEYADKARMRLVEAREMPQPATAILTLKRPPNFVGSFAEFPPNRHTNPTKVATKFPTKAPSSAKTRTAGPMTFAVDFAVEQGRRTGGGH